MMIAHLCLKHTLGNGLGKVYVTGCEGLTVGVGLIMLKNQGQEAKNGYLEVFLCKQDH